MFYFLWNICNFQKKEWYSLLMSIILRFAYMDSLQSFRLIKIWNKLISSISEIGDPVLFESIMEIKSIFVLKYCDKLNFVIENLHKLNLNQHRNWLVKEKVKYSDKETQYPHLEMKRSEAWLKLDGRLEIAEKLEFA